MREILMTKGANILLQRCAAVKPGEKVLVVTDFEMASMANVLASAALALGAEPMIMAMVPRTVDSEELPEAVGAAMRHADVIFNLVSKAMAHTSATKGALAAGARMVALSALQEDQLISGGIEADFDALEPFCLRVAGLLSEGNLARLTTPAGTNLTMSIEGRRANVHRGVARKPGEFTAGHGAECSAAPVEGTCEGTLVADASVPYFGIGVLQQPIVMQVKSGSVVEISGGRQAETVSRMMAAQHDPNVYNIAQLSFGLNPLCYVRGVMLDDEGSYGTCHIGIGTSAILGGAVKAKMHFDVVMSQPTLELDGQVVLRDGEWLIPEAEVARAMRRP